MSLVLVPVRPACFIRKMYDPTTFTQPKRKFVCSSSTYTRMPLTPQSSSSATTSTSSHICIACHALNAWQIFSVNKFKILDSIMNRNNSIQNMKWLRMSQAACLLAYMWRWGTEHIYTYTTQQEVSLHVVPTCVIIIYKRNIWDLVLVNVVGWLEYVHIYRASDVGWQHMPTMQRHNIEYIEIH